MDKFIDKKALLSFEFANSSGEVRPITFQNPYEICIAYKIEEVVPMLKKVEEFVQNGFYAAGYPSYESAQAFDKAFVVSKESKMPLLWFGIYQEPKVQELKSNGTYTVSNWEPSVTRKDYNDAIQEIKQYIENGDTYQTNYTIRLRSRFKGDDVAFFHTLKRAQSSHYCAYLNIGDYSILSASPELFFRLEGETITTRPMKGTIKRGLTASDDQAKAKWLYQSEKNRAENLMIVDLLRNDLGMIAEPGTVTVPKLFDIEHYPTVHQMTSTITANVLPNTHLIDIFKALFPCGSITGAPKISTMDIIAKLENAPREVYCGAIGYITPKREAVFNVPIRTVIIDHQNDQAEYGVGGGITWDSTNEDEYNEIISKAALLKGRPNFELLESILLENGQYFLLNEHLDRIQTSALYFGFTLNRQEMKKRLNDYASKREDGTWKIRLTLSEEGVFKLDGQQIINQEAPLQVALADYSVNSQNPFLYHKTTYREVYADFQRRYSHVYDVLLWNEKGEITEFTNGNVVIEIDGKRFTPSIECGLLAGTFRGSLLQKGEICEKVLSIEDVKKCNRIWFINSVRKWIEVSLAKSPS